MSGDAGVRNWSSTGPEEYTVEEAEIFDGEYLNSQYLVKRYACAQCPLGCGSLFRSSSKKWPLAHTSRPEYQTESQFGSLLLNKEPESMLKCNDLVNQAGFDSIAAGGTIAWIMECYNEGVFSKEELDGIDLQWGDSDAIVAMTEKMCSFEGCGKVFAKGSQAAADELEKGHEYLVVCSGIESPAHDAKMAPAMGRTYIYDPATGRHTQGGIGSAALADPPEVRYDYKAFGVRDMYGTALRGLIQNIGACIFCEFGYANSHELLLEMVNAVTGFNYSVREFYDVGIRSFTIRHAFSLRDGRTRKDYTASARVVGDPPYEKGPLAGISMDIEAMADALYTALGWSLEGKPYALTLDMLGGLELIKEDVCPPPAAVMQGDFPTAQIG